MYRTTARAVGALFLTATVAGILSVALLGPLDTLASPQFIADNAARISGGAVFVLVMAAAIALIPPVLFGVLKAHGEALSLGYVAARILEVVLLLPAVVLPLLLVAVATRVPDAGAPDGAAPADTVRILAQLQEMWPYATSSVFFCLGALLLNVLLYRSRLVPRWISGWALVAAVPYLIDACLMLGALSVPAAVHALLVAPLALNEMVLAVWLLTRGFRAPSSSALSAHVAETGTRAVSATTA